MKVGVAVTFCNPIIFSNLGFLEFACDSWRFVASTVWNLYIPKLMLLSSSLNFQNIRQSLFSTYIINKINLIIVASAAAGYISRVCEHFSSLYFNTVRIANFKVEVSDRIDLVDILWITEGLHGKIFILFEIFQMLVGI
mgnify:CR=1 FL=1